MLMLNKIVITINNSEEKRQFGHLLMHKPMLQSKSLGAPKIPLRCFKAELIIKLSAMEA